MIASAIRAFGRSWDYLATRKPDGIQLTISSAVKTIYQQTKPEGQKHSIKLP